MDFEKVFDTAVANGKVMEINSQPSRLDLNDELILLAKDFGLKFCIFPLTAILFLTLHSYDTGLDRHVEDGSKKRTL